jgi:hypothetical protein
VHGKRAGRGKMVWKNGEEYDGDWKDNLQVHFSKNNHFRIRSYNIHKLTAQRIALL